MKQVGRVVRSKVCMKLEMCFDDTNQIQKALVKTYLTKSKIIDKAIFAISISLYIITEATSLSIKSVTF